MAKVMKSYRFEESDIFAMRDIADELGLTDTDVILIGMYAFEELGISDALARKLEECPDDEWGRYAGFAGLKRCIDKVARKGDVNRVVWESFE